MSKRHFLDDSYQPCSSKQRKPSPNTNWEICALCQTSLQCPAKSSKPPIGKRYVSLVENLIEFQSLGCMPLDLSLERLDNGHGLEATLKVNSAKWHKTCRLKFNATTPKRMKQKIITTETEASTSKVLTRSSVCCKLTVESVCFFCNEPAGSAGLHDVSSYQLDQNVRECALHLEDAKNSPQETWSHLRQSITWNVSTCFATEHDRLHDFTGCDTVSSFAGRGKRTAWDTWNVYPDVTHAFEELLQMPDKVSDNSMALIERFVVLMYSRTSEIVEVNEARKQ